MIIKQHVVITDRNIIHHLGLTLQMTVETINHLTSLLNDILQSSDLSPSTKEIAKSMVDKALKIGSSCHLISEKALDCGEPERPHEKAL